MARNQTMSDKRAYWHLKKDPVLGRLPEESLKQLSEDAEFLEDRKRSVVYMPGDPADSIYLIQSGRVKISRVTPDGKELTLSYRGESELFGEHAIFGGAAREEMAEVVDNVEMISIPAPMVHEFLRKHIDFTVSMLLLMQERRVALEQKMEDLAFKDVGSKLAELLLGFSEQHGIKHDDGTLIDIKVTHQEMANLIGATRETVSLTLSQLKRKKLINSQGRKIIIQNKDALQAMM